MINQSKHQVVCFGEVLWDILPSATVPGGAPMNVAYHLHKHGKTPALVTRLGRDEDGNKLLGIFAAHGMCTDHFQFDSERETGKVYARPNADQEVVYEIKMPVAWDYINWKSDLNELVSKAELFVYGSLAARHEVSKNTLFLLLEAAKTKVLDINLRSPHFNKKIVGELMHRADVLKMNIAELELITGWFSSYTTVEDSVKAIQETFSIPDILITRGAGGAILYTDDRFIYHSGFRVDVVDTVGSGDAFLAGFLTRLLDHSQPQEALDFASKLGAFIATQQGACPSYEPADLNRVLTQIPECNLFNND